MTEKEFRDLCEKHDITYAQADDPRDWRKGVVSYDEVKAAAATMKRETAVRIWNSVVDKKIMKGSREMFYWRA